MNIFGSLLEKLNIKVVSKKGNSENSYNRMTAKRDININFNTITEKEKKQIEELIKNKNEEFVWKSKDNKYSLIVDRHGMCEMMGEFTLNHFSHILLFPI